jgi:RNA polymerase sigma-70 factor, ECF subfamily
MHTALAINDGIRTGRKEAIPTKADPDRDLLAALRRQDGMAAEVLVGRYGNRAYRLAIGITRNAQDAEEAVQDALWIVVRKVDGFRGEASFGSWIYRIVANAAYQKLRRHAQRQRALPIDTLPSMTDDDPVIDWSAATDDPAIQTELRGALHSAIGELPASHRAVIVLHDVEGLPLAEVAVSLGITLGTAKSRSHRARLFLRRRLAIFMSGAPDPVGAASPA